MHGQAIAVQAVLAASAVVVRQVLEFLWVHQRLVASVRDPRLGFVCPGGRWGHHRGVLLRMSQRMLREWGALPLRQGSIGIAVHPRHYWMTVVAGRTLGRLIVALHARDRVLG